MDVARVIGHSPRSAAAGIRATTGLGRCLGCPGCRGLCAELLELLNLPEAVLGKESAQ